MELPGASLYTGGSLNLDGINIAPSMGGSGEEEEAEAAEEEERRQQELQNVLKDAFDDLIEDDEEDVTLDHTDPSFHPEKLPTSTPFMAGRERSLYDELGGHYDMRRMNELPENDHHLEPSESLPGFQPVYDDTYRPSGGEFGPGSGLEPPAAVGFGSDGYSHGGGDDYRLGGGGYGSDGGPETPYGAGPGRGEFLALRPEETNNGLTEMCDTPRQHLDTSTDTSSAHYRHCYTSPRNELQFSPEVTPAGEVSSGDGVTRQEDRTTAERPGNMLDPGRYVTSKAKDAIMARTSREQLETLYEARGHEVSRLRAELERQRTETAAEVRAVRHRATLSEADVQGLEVSLQQARSLLVEKEEQTAKLTGEIDSLKIQLKASDDANKEQTSRLKAAEVTVDSLETQLTELRRSDQLARSQQLHQQLVDGLQRRHQDELAAQQQQLTALTVQLDGQKSLSADLQAKLTDSEEARHQQAADKADVINQLTAGLESAQSRCHRLMQGDAAQLQQQLATEQQRRQETEHQLQTAQERADSLQRDLEACESVLRLGVGEESASSSAGAAEDPLHSTPVSASSGGGDTAPFSLRRELTRALENARARRQEVGRLRSQLEKTQQQLRETQPRLLEREAEVVALKQQVSRSTSSGAANETAEQLLETQRQLLAEQQKRQLAEDQLRKIRAEGEKVHKTAEELRRCLAEQVEEADRTRLQAVEEVRQACLQLHDDMMDKLRTEKVEEYETELLKLREELSAIRSELEEVKDLYVKVCQEKNEQEAEMQTEREAAVTERERAVKAALDHHYDRWSADWRAGQAAAVQRALEAERTRLRSLVGSASTQTSPAPERRCLGTQTVSALEQRCLGTQTVSAPPPAPAPRLARSCQTLAGAASTAAGSQTAAPDTADTAVQCSHQAAAQDIDKLKKKLKRASLDKRKLEVNVQQLEANLKESACIFETKLKKERVEAERRLRELRRRPSGGGESELVRNLRVALQDKDEQLRQLTAQTGEEKDQLCGTFEKQLRQALEQERMLTAAVSAERHHQLTAEQLTQQCEQLRAEAERAAAEHRRQLQQKEQQYQAGLASYRTLIENNVAELSKAEEELRRQAAAGGEVLKAENGRLTAENARLAESYDSVLAQRRADRESYQKQVAQLSTQLEASEEVRVRISELESRLETGDAEAADLRSRLTASKEKLRQYHGYVKEREAHYDSEFRRMEAEYRVAVGKMKEKVMLARERAGGRPVCTAAATQTAVTGQDLVGAVREMNQFQDTVSQLRGELLHALDKCRLPASGADAGDLPTFRSHAVERGRPPRRGAAADGSRPASLNRAGGDSQPSTLSRPASASVSGPAVSPLLATKDHALASLERIRRDLTYIFAREPGAAGGGEGGLSGRRGSSEELLARLARLPLTPPSRDGDGPK